MAQTTTTGTGAATTRYAYDAFGAMASVRIEDARARDVTLVSDTNGQAIRRDEVDGLTTQGDPHERWYRFGGVEIGHVGNNGAQPADYARSVDARGRSAGSQPFAVVDPRYGAGFASGAERITSYATGSAAGGYAVRSGDTLAGIAQSLWGDSALWYRLAEANGLTAGSALPVGRTLSVPAGVVRSRYNASTFRPYDPADTLGDTNPVSASPTAKAAGKAKCGAFGQILLSVIAIAVTAVLPGSGVIAGAINGAIGSVVSQGVGLATGLQDGFSFKGVALAAIGGGVGKALGGVNAFGTASGVVKVGIDVARGAIGSAATQGIALATGLQDRFDWAGVAAAGVIGGIGGAADRGLARAGAGGFGRDLGASAASALAGAGARSLLTGTDFGDTILAVLPDVIGTTLGRAVARGIAGSGGGGASRRGITPSTLLDDGADLPLGRASAYDGGAATPYMGRADDIVVTASRAQVAAARSGATRPATPPIADAIMAAPSAMRQQVTFGGLASTHGELDARRAGLAELIGYNRANGIPIDASVVAEANAGLAYNALTITLGEALADANSLDLVRQAVPPLDFGLSAGAIAQGQGGIGDYVTVGASLLPAIGKLAGKALVGETAMARAARLGREGEAAAGITGAKSGIVINGRMRFPDEVSRTLVKEVKNVARQGWTSQLRDYSDLAGQRNIPFELYVRGPLHPSGQTVLTRPLKSAVSSGAVRLNFIPGTF